MASEVLNEKAMGPKCGAHVVRAIDIIFRIDERAGAAEVDPHGWGHRPQVQHPHPQAWE